MVRRFQFRRVASAHEVCCRRSADRLREIDRIELAIQALPARAGPPSVEGTRCQVGSSTKRAERHWHRRRTNEFHGHHARRRAHALPGVRVRFEPRVGASAPSSAGAVARLEQMLALSDGRGNGCNSETSRASLEAVRSSLALLEECSQLKIVERAASAEATEGPEDAGKASRARPTSIANLPSALAASDGRGGRDTEMILATMEAVSSSLVLLRHYSGLRSAERPVIMRLTMRPADGAPASPSNAAHADRELTSSAHDGHLDAGGALG